MFRKYALAASSKLASLEASLAEFTAGRMLDGNLVSEFLSIAKPSMSSPAEVVFFRRLANTYCPDHEQYADALEPSSVPTLALSVVVSCLADSSPTQLPLLELCVRELISRQPGEPRVLARLCKGVVKLARMDLVEEVAGSLENADWSKFTPSQMVQFLRFGVIGDEKFLSTKFLTQLSLLAPLLSASESVSSLVSLASIPPTSAVHASIVSRLKDGIQIAELTPSQRTHAVAALARMGVLTSRCRGLVFKNQLTRVSSAELTQLGLALLTNISDLKPEFFPSVKSGLKSICRRKNTPIDLLVRAHYALGECEESLLAKALPSLPLETRMQLVELRFLFPEISLRDTFFEFQKVTLQDELSLLRSDPVAREVAACTGQSWGSSMSDSCALPCLHHKGVALDVDSLWVSQNRFIRARIAEKLGIKYRVVDSLAWAGSEDKETFLTNLVEGEEVFSRTLDEDRIENPSKPPYFGYVRKIDLK